MFIKLLLLSIFFVALALLALGIRILVLKGGRFPQTHVGRNKEMVKRGITCASSIDTGCNPTDDFPGCSACRGD